MSEDPLVVLEWLAKDPAVQQTGEIDRMRSMALVWSHKLSISQEHSSLLTKKELVMLVEDACRNRGARHREEIRTMRAAASAELDPHVL